MTASVNGAVDLYHSNTKRLETQSGGVRIRDRLGVNCDPNGSHPMQVDHDEQYIIAIRNTAADSSNFPWLCHKEINSTQAFAIHINGVSGDPFHVDQNGGIFLNKETATANRLGDYEEGTWSPTLHGTWYNSGTFRNTTYTKIGRLVTCHFDLYQTSNNMGWGANASVRGWPFAAISNMLTTATLTTFSYQSSHAKFIPNYVDDYTNAQMVLHTHSQNQSIRHLLCSLTYMTT